MESSSAQRLSTFATDPDEDLLGYMAMQADDSESARSAGAEFYSRHKGFLFGVLKNRGFGRVFGNDQLVDFVQETFCAAYERAGTYRSSGGKDPDGQRKAVRAWLASIANNVAHTALSRGKSVVADAGYEECADLPADETVPVEQESAVKKATSEVLDTLSEREQDVVRTTMLYFKPGESHQRLPNEVARSLAERWATTPANIRAIRKRAFDKIKMKIEPMLKGAKERAR